MPSAVQGEPEYVDQVPRLLAYRQAHPDVDIVYCGPYWKAVIRENDGCTEVNRIHLWSLMDKLEELALAGVPDPRGG